MGHMRNSINIGTPGLVLCAGLAMLLAGCNTAAGPESIAKDDTVFSVSSEFPTQQGATFNISHNGPDGCLYYGFSHEPDQTADEAIAGKLEELKASAETSSLRDIAFSGKTYTDVVTGLLPNREYAYTVFGLNEDYTVYGTSATCTFQTQTGGSLFRLNEVVSNEYDAEIQVICETGKEDYPYYVFWTDDNDTPASDLINAQRESLTDPASSVHRGRSTFKIPGDIPGSLPALERGKKYRVIVTGMYDDGQIYGLPTEMTFKTERGDLPYVINENWTVEYAGKGIYASSPSDNVRVISEDSERYFIVTVPASELTDAVQGDDQALRTVIETETAAMQALIDWYQGQGYAATWENYTYTASTEEPFEILDDEQEYYALAIGIDVDGVVTGYYAQSKKFSPEVTVSTPEYEKWLGTWTVTGKYAAGEDAEPEDISFDVVISELLPGVGYSVSGFGMTDAFAELGELPALTALYDKETQRLQWAGSYLTEVSISGMQASVYFAALAGTDLIAGDNFVIAESALSADGNSSEITACPIQLADGSIFTPESMGYVGEVQYYGYMLMSANPQLPMTMTRVDSSTSAVASYKKADAQPERIRMKMQPKKYSLL